MKMWLNGQLISANDTEISASATNSASAKKPSSDAANSATTSSFSDATISANSAGAFLGWGVFTTIGIWNSRPFALDLHFARLRHDAQRAQIEYSIDEETLRRALDELIFANEIVHGMARITVTKCGDGRWNLASGSDISVLAQPISASQNLDFSSLNSEQTSPKTRDPATPDFENSPLFPASDSSFLAKSNTRNDGLRVTLSPFSLHSKRATKGIKTTSYLDAQLAWHEAQTRGFDEAILLNERGEMCEGARSNLFFVRENALCTPAISSGCLPGISRNLILNWAHESEIETREGKFSLDELQFADAFFLTSAATGIREVGHFAGAQNFDFNLQNPIVAHLKNRWQKAVAAL